MFAMVICILLVVLVLVATYLNFQIRIHPNHAFLIELDQPVFEVIFSEITMGYCSRGFQQLLPDDEKKLTKN